MQNHHSTPDPPPDVRPRASRASPAATDPGGQSEAGQIAAIPISVSDADFLVVSLFALRLARDLIQSLGTYPERLEDMTWLENFLGPYDQSYELAKVTGMARKSYLEMYPQIVSRMTMQPKYPISFTALNPVVSRRHETRHGKVGMTDAERLDTVNFADAAREWGSTVLVPQSEAERMHDLADHRRVADAGKGRGMADPAETGSRKASRQFNF